MELEANLKLSLLSELYKNLLTQKQQKMLKDFLDNNLSISELAVEYNSTRQAVNDLLKRTFKTLEEYENKLGLLNKLESIKKNVSVSIEELKKQNLDKKFIEAKLNEILEVL
ncbi:MAG: DNA-binding protein [Clostridia bacterium]|nr:DNA-binding protein [Clostridia bacterium]